LRVGRIRETHDYRKNFLQVSVVPDLIPLAAFFGGCAGVSRGQTPDVDNLFANYNGQLPNPAAIHKNDNQV
jgi:hypothetical protein